MSDSYFNSEKKQTLKKWLGRQGHASHDDLSSRQSPPGARCHVRPRRATVGDYTHRLNSPSAAFEASTLSVLCPCPASGLKLTQIRQYLTWRQFPSAPAKINGAFTDARGGIFLIGSDNHVWRYVMNGTNFELDHCYPKKITQSLLPC